MTLIVTNAQSYKNIPRNTPPWWKVWSMQFHASLTFWTQEKKVRHYLSPSG